MNVNRNNRANIAKETLEIIDRGWYEVADGKRVEIASQVNACLKRTTLYRPRDFDTLDYEPRQTQRNTTFEVTNETTLSAAHRLVVEHAKRDVLLLNFASAKNPGGGFRGGSQAQEESLARSSALYSSLEKQPDYYQANRACRTALYTDHMILSPDVPVFRGDDGDLLSEHYLVTILTAPAVNAGAVHANEPANVANINHTMRDRIEKVLTVAADNGFGHLVLGAWGCGVFRNLPAEVAGLFARVLLHEGQFAHAFVSVTFAVFDRTADESIIRPFHQHFSAGT